MNSKALKKLRRDVREMFADLPLRALETSQGRSVSVPLPGLNLDGTQRMGLFAITGTTRNAAGTQRAAYRDIKKSTPASLYYSARS